MQRLTTILKILKVESDNWINQTYEYTCGYRLFCMYTLYHIASVWLGWLCKQFQTSTGLLKHHLMSTRHQAMAQFQQLHPLVHQMDQKVLQQLLGKKSFVLKKIGKWCGISVLRKAGDLCAIMDEFVCWLRCSVAFVWWIGSICRVSSTIWTPCNTSIFAQVCLSHVSPRQQKNLRNPLRWKFSGQDNAWLIAALIFLLAMVGGQGFSDVGRLMFRGLICCVVSSRLLVETIQIWHCGNKTSGPLHFRAFFRTLIGTAFPGSLFFLRRGGKGAPEKVKGKEHKELVEQSPPQPPPPPVVSFVTGT